MTPPDLLDPDFYADIDGMHDAFRAMRAEGPVWRDEKNELWAVVRHAPLVDVERNADVFSSSGCYRSRVAPQEEDMIAKDDPAHREQRALVVEPVHAEGGAASRSARSTQPSTTSSTGSSTGVSSRSSTTSRHRCRRG